ncbi:MAG: 30S ribosomal protein S2 [Acidobacteria bacterium]|nr:30S ribosomal protein S2 [Acidobacteriota bacterium]
MVAITMKQLLEAGVHFGHQTKRWNPKMKEYIFGERNGIYIIDLQKSIRLFRNAIQFVYELGAQGKTLLFLGTKRQAQEVIREEAERCGMYYVNQRWLGGLLTNFVTIQKSVKRYRELEAMRANGQYDLFSKKEVARLERERKKLEKNLSGIKEMASLPDAIFVVDTNTESIAIKEARKLGIPVVGVADTNCDPQEVDYIIPGNDDALRAIRLIAGTIAQAYLDGKAVFEAQQKEIAEQMEKQRQLQAQQAAAAREAAARAAAEAASKRALEAKEGVEAVPVPEGAVPGEAAGKPRTTIKRTLQRKVKPKKADSEAQIEPAAASAVEEQTQPDVAPEPGIAGSEEQNTSGA